MQAARDRVGHRGDGKGRVIDVAQTGTEWKPNRRQKKVLDAAQEAGVNRTITKVCEEAGVPRRTFYNWLTNEGFARAWDEVWRRAIVRHMPSIVAAMLGKAGKGDVSAARLLADMAGILKQQVDITTGGEKLAAVTVYLPEMDELETESGATGEVSS